MSEDLVLISHRLCPYVQRAVIALTEKQVPFDRIDIDLANKPDWFLALSPLGKTPVLTVRGTPIFESAVILEYLEETAARPLHPADPLARAEHRAWIEFGSAVLDEIAGFYAARDEQTFAAKKTALGAKFSRLESSLEARAGGPWFAGAEFSLVDATFGPVFRYFDTFDGIADFGILASKPRLAIWRRALRDRPSVRAAVAPDYPDRLDHFLRSRDSRLAALMREAGPV